MHKFIISIILSPKLTLQLKRGLHLTVVGRPYTQDSFILHFIHLWSKLAQGAFTGHIFSNCNHNI